MKQQHLDYVDLVSLASILNDLCQDFIYSLTVLNNLAVLEDYPLEAAISCRPVFVGDALAQCLRLLPLCL